MLVLVFLTAGLSLGAVLNGRGQSACCFARPAATQLQKTPGPGLAQLKTSQLRPGVQAISRYKGLATVPSSLEFGNLFNRTVERVSSFSLSAFLQKYDHLIWSQVVRTLSRVPPLTGAYLVLSTVPALLSYLFNNNFPFAWMTFDLDKVLKGQVWRLFTPYFLFGQFWLNHYMLVSSAMAYMSNVELAHVNRPEKFIEFLAFGVLSLSAYSFAEAYLYKRWAITEIPSFENLAFHFQIFVLYFWSRLNEGHSVECMDFFSIPAQLIPYIFVLQNYLFNQGGLPSDLAALALSYVYFTFFSGRKPCPLFKAFNTDALRGLYLRFRDELPY